MDYKIIKQTNPLGGVKYFPKVKIRFLWVIPVWRYVYYSSYSEEVELRDYEQEYPTLETAKQADFIIENKLTELERNVDFFIVLSSDYPDDELLKGKFVADTKNPDRTMEMEMTVNGFIKHLQGLNPELRAKKIVITAPNGLQFEPVIKQQLIDKYNVFGGVENVECMVITYD